MFGFGHHSLEVGDCTRTLQGHEKLLDECDVQLHLFLTWETANGKQFVSVTRNYVYPPSAQEPVFVSQSLGSQGQEGTSEAQARSRTLVIPRYPQFRRQIHSAL